MRAYTSDASGSSVLRPARPEDAESIAAVWHAGWADGHLGHTPEALRAHRRLQDFRDRVPPRIAQTTVAMEGTRLLGFVMVDGDEVEQVYVSREARGMGVADLLLAHAERVVGKEADVAWLAVAPGNARARRFYERCGWRDAGALEYAAETADGTLAVPCRRYEKRIGRD